VALADRRDEFDRVSDVAQGLSPTGLVQDAVDLGSEGGGVCGEEDVTADRRRRILGRRGSPVAPM
jgi:hypothetical protein